ncbi:hypothetical protein JOC85_000476 [Bacillus mesophilus]|nr:hypothetical protein [Bacillus mesophilus]
MRKKLANLNVEKQTPKTNEVKKKKKTCGCGRKRKQSL